MTEMERVQREERTESLNTTEAHFRLKGVKVDAGSNGTICSNFNVKYLVFG